MDDVLVGKVTIYLPDFGTGTFNSNVRIARLANADRQSEFLVIFCVFYYTEVCRWVSQK